MIEIEKPESLVEELEKPLALENASYPYQLLDHRRFEKLIYWIYRAEIETGVWSELYDDIQLMSGVRDGARDCVMYQKSGVTGIIQCKHSENNTALKTPILFKEIIKFGLYCLKKSLSLSVGPFYYYIASSAGFHETCTDFIKNYQDEIFSNQNFRQWTEQVINGNKFLNDLSFETVENELRTILSSFKMVDVGPEELNRLLETPRHAATVGAFFKVKTVVDKDALVPLTSKVEIILDKLGAKSAPLDNVQILDAFKAVSFSLLIWKSYISESHNIHVPRPQTDAIFNWVISPLRSGDSNLAVLAGDAGAGKTVVLKDLHEKLELASIPVMGIKADKFYANDISSLERELDLRHSIFEMIEILRSDFEKIVIIIDQLDALSQSLSSNRKFLTCYNLLIEKLKKIDGVRVVLSIRKFDLEYDPDLAHYSQKNKVIQLGVFSDSEVLAILKELNIDSKKISARLLKTICSPQNLQVFHAIYHSTLSLEGLLELHDLYDELWDQKISKAPSLNNAFAPACADFIYQLADQMNTEQKISIKLSALESIDQNVLNYLLSNNILAKSGNQIQFFHQTFYDYAYARHFVNSGSSILNYIQTYRHSLHIRSGLKMILAYLRDKNAAAYIDIVKTIIRSNSIRFHIRLLVINLIGFSLNPQEDELQLARKYLLKKPELKTLFVESCYGENWIRFLIDENIPDELVADTESWLEKIERQRFFVQMLQKTRLNQVFNNKNRVEQRAPKINLFFSILIKSLPDARNTIADYLIHVKDFAEKEQIVLRVLHNIKVWDSREPFALLEKYQETAYNSFIGYNYVIEDIMPFDLDWAFSSYEHYIDYCLSKDSRSAYDLNFDYHQTNPLKKAIEIDEVKAFSFGCLLICKLSAHTQYRSSSPGYFLEDDRAFSLHQHQNEKHLDHHELYSDVIRLAEVLSSEAHPALSAWLKASIHSNSSTMLQLAVHAMIKNPLAYSTEASNFVVFFNQKGGFTVESNLNYQVRVLLGECYPFWNNDQKKIVNRILLGIDNPSEKTVWTDITGKKRHSLEYYGERLFSYLSALPFHELSLQPQLKKHFQELQRKFKVEKLVEKPIYSVARPVQSPFSQQAYQHMSHEQWLQGFLRFDADNISGKRGALRMNSQAFYTSVANAPGAFYPFVSDLIDNPSIPPDYWIKGMEGLKEGKFDPQQVMTLYKKAIHVELKDTSNIFPMIWLSDYFIKNHIADIEIVEYLCGLVLNHEIPEQNLSDDQLLNTSINTVSGAAVYHLLNCTYNRDFMVPIFDMAFKVAEGSTLTLKAALVVKIAYLLNFDVKKTVDAFVKAMENAPESLVKVSVNSLQYLVHHDFSALLPLIRRWLNYSTAHESLGAILTWCWINEYQGSAAIFWSLLKQSTAARLGAHRVAYENIFDENKNVKQKCSHLFLYLLNDKSNEISQAYDRMFLHIENQPFENWLPYLKAYARSKVVKKSPHYFMEYLVKQSGKHPEECLFLIKNYKGYAKPNHSSGPYYTNEPVKIVLNAYTVLNNKNDKAMAKQAVDLFDKMLSDEHLRVEANQVLELVEK